MTLSKYLLFPLLLFTASFTYAQTDSADLFYKKGLEEKDKGRVMEVWRNMDKAAQYAPDNIAIKSELAQSLLALRKYPQAYIAFKELESKGITTADNYKQLLELSFNMRRYEDAVAYADKYKKADPSAKVAYYKGKAHYENENYGEAIKHLNEAAVEEPANADIPYMVGRSYTDMQNFKLAFPYFEKAISLDSSKANRIYEAGLILYAQHRDKESLTYILLAGEKGYKKDNSYLENLAIAYLNTNQFDEGVNMLKKILERKPADLNILNMLAETHYDAKKYDQAIEYWDKMLEYDMKNASALYMIGMSYQKKGEKSKGIQLCDKAIEMDPSLESKKQKMMTMGM